MLLIFFLSIISLLEFECLQNNTAQITIKQMYNLAMQTVIHKIYLNITTVSFGSGWFPHQFPPNDITINLSDDQNLEIFINFITGVNSTALSLEFDAQQYVHNFTICF